MSCLQLEISLALSFVCPILTTKLLFCKWLQKMRVIKESSILRNRVLFRLKKKKHQGGYLGPAGNRTKMLQEKQ